MKLKPFIVGAAAAISLLLLISAGYAWKDSIQYEAVMTVQQEGVELQTEIAPFPPQMLASATLSIRLSDGSGQPVSGAEMSATLSMPHMMCGRIEVKISEAEPGIYTGEAVPLMAGMWEMLVVVHSGGSLVEAVHPFEAVQ
ncbi:FixH family protein [Paenibacillus sp. MER TA 81-3]|uniref:FixH family protein n=1 Tax=Paenibacillus sp. MER TA 81-3 TaxID=2939573 RepID=UPI0020420357|nr:FixH family protein [Paenibacillus sp. MER TA 81-3]MCM3339805.1 FixH family protein [Paenibacillus sp. MER TA 81-3]